jgi:type I restriction enzyme R subunit
MAYYGGDKSTEYLFQNDLIKLLLDNGWLLGDPKKYNRVLASSFGVLSFALSAQNKT